MSLVLSVRRYGTGTSGTFSLAELQEDGSTIWSGFMLEKPWLNNYPGRSCIPEGTYSAFFRTPANTPASVTHMGVYELVGVPGRTAILIHVANKDEDLLGCLAPGERVGNLKDSAGNVVGAVLGSRRALDALHAAARGRDLVVKITWTFTP